MKKVKVKRVKSSQRVRSGWGGDQLTLAKARQSQLTWCVVSSRQLENNDAQLGRNKSKVATNTQAILIYFIFQVTIVQDKLPFKTMIVWNSAYVWVTK